MARKRKSYGGIFILILLFITAVVVTFTTPVFNITSVAVEGNETVQTEEILHVANIPLGMNTYRVSMKKAAGRVEMLPYVLDAKAGRRFPARVVIKVTERKEAGAVTCPGGYAVIDKECRVLRLTAEAENLPIISGATVETATPGTEIQMKDARFVGDLKTLFTAIETEKLGIEFARISIDSAVEIVLETKGGMEIHLGSLDELSYKLQMCRNILEGGRAGLNKDSSGILRWTSEGQFSYRQNKN